MSAVWAGYTWFNKFVMSIVTLACLDLSKNSRIASIATSCVPLTCLKFYLYSIYFHSGIGNKAIYVHYFFEIIHYLVSFNYKI